MRSMDFKQTKDKKKMYLNWEIEFGCIGTKRVLLEIENQSLCLEEMVHSHSFKGVNAYKVDLQGEYNVSAIFKVYNLCLFDVCDDSRSNYFEERGDDVTVAMTWNNPLRVSSRSILSSKIKWIKEEFNGLSQKAWVKKIQMYQF